jgi:hypothetical protein
MTDTAHRDHRSAREILLDLSKKVTHLMATDAEVLAAAQQLKTDLETAVAAIQAEFVKLEGELPNAAVLDEAKALVDGLDTTVKGVVVPTA